LYVIYLHIPSIYGAIIGVEHFSQSHSFASAASLTCVWLLNFCSAKNQASFIHFLPHPITAKNFSLVMGKDLVIIFTLFISTTHRGGEAYMTAFGFDKDGMKHVFGFRQGNGEP